MPKSLAFSSSLATLPLSSPGSDCSSDALNSSPSKVKILTDSPRLKGSVSDKVRLLSKAIGQLNDVLNRAELKRLSLEEEFKELIFGEKNNVLDKAQLVAASSNNEEVSNPVKEALSKVAANVTADTQDDSPSPVEKPTKRPSSLPGCSSIVVDEQLHPPTSDSIVVEENDAIEDADEASESLVMSPHQSPPKAVMASASSAVKVSEIRSFLSSLWRSSNSLEFKVKNLIWLINYSL